MHRVTKPQQEGVDKVRVLAAEGSRERELQDQLDLGHDTNGFELLPQFTPPLHLACAAGNVEECRMLLDGTRGKRARAGALVNLPDHAVRGSRTPLHLATINGSVAICQMLLRRGADHRALDECGVNPLHTACANGHYRVVELLLAHADADASEKSGLYPTVAWKKMYVNQPNAHNGDTPLHVACRSGYSYAATALLKYVKAKVSFPSKVSADSVAAFIHAKNRDGRTAKDLAIFNRLQDAEIALSNLERTLVRMRTGKRREVEKGWSTMIDPNPPNKHSFSLG